MEPEAARAPGGSPESVVDAMARAYNRGDIDAYLDVFSEDATIVNVETGTVMAIGHDSIRSFYSQRFATSPDLRATVLDRMELGSYVVDRELVHGIGEAPLEVLAIYEVRDSLIRSLQIVGPAVNAEGHRSALAADPAR